MITWLYVPWATTAWSGPLLPNVPTGVTTGPVWRETTANTSAPPRSRPAAKVIKSSNVPLEMAVWSGLLSMNVNMDAMPGPVKGTYPKTSAMGWVFQDAGVTPGSYVNWVMGHTYGSMWPIAATGAKTVFAKQGPVVRTSAQRRARRDAPEINCLSVPVVTGAWSGQRSPTVEPLVKLAPARAANPVATSARH